MPTTTRHAAKIAPYLASRSTPAANRKRTAAVRSRLATTALPERGRHRHARVSHAMPRVSGNLRPRTTEVAGDIEASYGASMTLKTALGMVA